MWWSYQASVWPANIQNVFITSKLSAFITHRKSQCIIDTLASSHIWLLLWNILISLYCSSHCFLFFFIFCMFHVRTLGHMGRTKKSFFFYKSLSLWNVCKQFQKTSYPVKHMHSCPAASFLSALLFRLSQDTTRTISSQKHNFFPMYGFCDVITGSIREMCCINLQQWSHRKWNCLHAFIWRDTDCP